MAESVVAADLGGTVVVRPRVRHLLGEDANGMWLKTFHSACVMILRREAERLGHDPNFTIYDSGDSRALLKRLIKEMSADIHKLTPGLVASVISNAKNELHDAEDFMRNTDAADPAASWMTRSGFALQCSRAMSVSCARS